MITDATTALQKQSRTTATVFSWIAGIAGFWVFAEIAYVPLKRVGAALYNQQVAEAATTFGETFAAALPTLALIAALWTVRGLFRQFSEGQVFTAQTGRTMGQFGLWLIASGGLALLEQYVLLPALGTETREPLLNADIMLVCVGFAIRLLGRAFAVAADIKADSDQIV